MGEGVIARARRGLCTLSHMCAGTTRENICWVLLSYTVSVTAYMTLYGPVVGVARGCVIGTTSSTPPPPG